MKSLNTLYRFTRKGILLPGHIYRETPPTRLMFELDYRFDLANHYPDGPNWGFAGSGPSQAALAVLADFLEDDDRALDRYQDFKKAFLVNEQRDAFLIDGGSIWSWLSLPTQEVGGSA